MTQRRSYLFMAPSAVLVRSDGESQSLFGCTLGFNELIEAT